MEQLPPWLTAAVMAAGMTAYADDLDRKIDSPSPADTSALDEQTPPRH
jgi:hypothetical protein